MKYIYSAPNIIHKTILNFSQRISDSVYLDLDCLSILTTFLVPKKVRGIYALPTLVSVNTCS